MDCGERRRRFSDWMRSGGGPPAVRTKSWAEAKGYPEFNVAQPRVPAGHPGAGQWTDAPEFTAPKTHEPRPLRQAMLQQRRQQQVPNADTIPVARRRRRGRGNPEIRTSTGKRIAATAAQALKYWQLYSKALIAIKAAKRLNPNWNPRHLGDPQTADEAIARQEDTMRQAEQYVRERTGRNVDVDHLGLPSRRSGDRTPETFGEVMAPYGKAVGKEGEKDTTHELYLPDMLERLGRLSLSAQPILPPEGYPGDAFELPGGERYGVRSSKKHGITIDRFKGTKSYTGQVQKWHWRPQ